MSDDERIVEFLRQKDNFSHALRVESAMDAVRQKLLNPDYS